MTNIADEMISNLNSFVETSDSSCLVFDEDDENDHSYKDLFPNCNKINEQYLK